MLGDMPEAWQHHPANVDADGGEGKVRLWNAVRLTFLFSLWCVRQDPEPAARTSAAVVERTIAELQSLMWAQFMVAAVSDDTINALPTNLLTADLKEGSLEMFTACWACNDTLCVVDREADGRAVLRMRLSRAHPVQAVGNVENNGGDSSDDMAD
jgi:hypothetical protein